MENFSQLISGIAHEFNNLLMIAQGYLDILRMDLTGDEAHTQQVDRALEATHACTDLIKKLIAFSNIPLQKPKLLKFQDMTPLLTKLLQPLAGSTIQFILEVPENLWAVMLDEEQLKISLVNLVKNAVDAMQGEGTVSVKISNITFDGSAEDAAPPGDYVKISVTDNGCGIPSHHIDRVFEPFFTTKNISLDAGLGLCMVQGFVNQSNGYIKVQSEAEKGTEIDIYFPKATDQSEIPSQKVPFRSLYQLHGTETILLVEDQERLRQLTATQLQSLGYQVLQAASTSVALEILQQNPTIHLLLTDIILQGDLSGIELVKQALKQKPDLKIVYMSGYPQQRLQNKYQLDNEKYPILVKPFARLDLALMVHDVLNT
jgi:CheY-like chemotaxis protein/two-component sensor histidine kinase